MKRLIALLMLLCLLPLSVLAEEAQFVYNRTENLTEEFVFPEGTPVLEIVFPRVYSSDCAILRFGDETMTQQVSDELKAEADALMEKIISGEIVVDSVGEIFSEDAVMECTGRVVVREV